MAEMAAFELMKEVEVEVEEEENNMFEVEEEEDVFVVFAIAEEMEKRVKIFTQTSEMSFNHSRFSALATPT